MSLWTKYKTKEALNEHLQKRKEIYQQHLIALYTLREFFPSVDKKIYNVRIRKAIDELPGLSCYEARWGLFTVCARDLGYNDNDIITFTDNILDAETGKRIDNEQVQIQLTNKIQENRKLIAGIDKDILDGFERFQELLKIKDYYRKLYQQFTRDTQRSLERDCEIAGVSLWSNF